jgi:hypothetical protein
LLAGTSTPSNSTCSNHDKHSTIVTRWHLSRTAVTISTAHAPGTGFCCLQQFITECATQLNA